MEEQKTFHHVQIRRLGYNLGYDLKDAASLLMNLKRPPINYFTVHLIIHQSNSYFHFRKTHLAFFRPLHYVVFHLPSKIIGNLETNMKLR